MKQIRVLLPAFVASVCLSVPVTQAFADPVGEPVPTYAFDPAFASPGNCGSASIAYSGTDENGNVLVAWKEPRVGTERGTILRAALVGEDGQLTTTPVDVSVDYPARPIDACNGSPSVTAGPDGEFLILWGNERLPQADERAVGQIIDTSGQLSGTNFVVSDWITDIKSVQAAWGGGDSRYLVTIEDQTGNSNPGQFIDRDGVRIGSQFLLISQTNPQWPDVAYGSGIWAATAMSCASPCGRGPYGVTVTASGPQGSDYLIPPAVQDEDSFGNSIVYNDFTNEFLVVWSNKEPGFIWNPFAMRLTADGTPVGSPILLDAVGDGPHPQVAAGGEDGYLVTWHDWTTSAYYVVATQLGTDGQPTSTTQTVSLPNPTVSYRPRVTYAKDTHCFVVAWNGNGNPDNPYSPPASGANVWTRNWSPNGTGPCDETPPTPPAPAVTGKGKAGATKLKVKVTCGGTAPCEIRLAGKEKGRKGKLVPKTVQVGANGKVVTLRYTGALERSLLERGGGKVRVTASQTDGGSATTTVLVRVSPSPVTG